MAPSSASWNRCPSCDTDDVITITMAAGDTDLCFSTCHECEAKWWQKDGEQVPLNSVLGAVAAR